MSEIFSVDTINAIGPIALSAINAIGLVALSPINAIGLIAVGTVNTVGLIAVGGGNSFGFIAIGGMSAIGFIAIGNTASGVFALSYSGRGKAIYMLSPGRRDAKAVDLFTRWLPQFMRGRVSLG